jgi:hypothetical protein
MLFGTAFLALNASVVSAPTHLMTLKNIAYILIGFFFFLGIYFIKTALRENRFKTHRICNKSFYKIMLKNKYKIHVSGFAKSMNIGENDAVEYIESRKKISIGILKFHDNGDIVINKFRTDTDR